LGKTAVFGLVVFTVDLSRLAGGVFDSHGVKTFEDGGELFVEHFQLLAVLQLVGEITSLGQVVSENIDQVILSLWAGQVGNQRSGQ